MSELDRLQDAFLKADRLAQSGNEVAREDARMFAAEIRRLQSAPPSFTGQVNKGVAGFMGQVNKGVAESTGGLVDFLNPFDNAAWQGTPIGMGSAQTAIERGMGAVGIDVAQDDPETVVAGMGRGFGRAAGALPTVTGAIGQFRSVPGIVGAVADDAYRSLSTPGGVAIEGMAGAISGGAGEAAEQAGAPEWVQNTAEILAPLSIPAAASTARGAYRVAQKLPLAGAVIKGGKAAARAFAPMSEVGAREVARSRVHDLVGGEDRAAELGKGIDPKDVIGRTPAQQTGDENLRGLERAAMSENPNIRVALDQRLAASRSAAQDRIGDMGGDPGEARRFFDRRLQDVRASMQARVDRVVTGGNDALAGSGPLRTESANSTTVHRRIRHELDAQKMQEAELWGAVPEDVLVAPSQARTVARKWEKRLGRAQAADMPRIARQLLIDDGGYAELETAREVHGLYSELRETARNASAGGRTKATLARVANELADAILGDMDAIEAVSRPLTEARAFTRALHETFDRGAVGRILRRTPAGDEQIDPETALARTVGRGGAQALADDESIRTAAIDAGGEISDYLRGRFAQTVFKPTGDFDRAGALRWMRDNSEVLSRHPELSGELRRALASRETAESFAARAEVRAKLMERSPVAEFGRGQEQSSVLSILGADNPALAARSVVQTARKDATGKALGGVKGAFTDFLIGKSGTADGMSGAKVRALLADRNTRAAMRQVFSKDEMDSLDRVADALASLDAPSADVGGVINSPANQIIDYVSRIAAARMGGQLGGGSMGGSLQAANIATGRARRLLEGLTNDRARQLLMDAVQDPALMRALLLQPKGVDLPPYTRAKLAPYLVGAVSGQAADREPLRIDIGGKTP